MTDPVWLLLLLLLLVLLVVVVVVVGRQNLYEIVAKGMIQWKLEGKDYFLQEQKNSHARQ